MKIIVAGLGAMGSNAACELARRGHLVLGLDTFAPPHSQGSSHGKSRIIREAYFEDPRYVPLVQRAYQKWAELEEESGTSLLLRTGGLMLGPADGVMVTGAKRSAELHHLPHELLDAKEIVARAPGFSPDAETMAVWEPNAGVLVPEAAISVALDIARRNGAEIHTNEALISWRAIAGGVEVTTERATYQADRLILTAGAWLRPLLPGLELPLVVQRNVIYWFKSLRHPENFRPPLCPIFVWEYAADKIWYGLPDTGEGLKVGRHHHGKTYDADTVPREVDANEIREVRELVQRFMPDAAGELLESVVCLYTNTPDGHFILDRHPQYSQVIVASVCSGHGFKFSPAIGEVLADLATGQTSPFDLTPFALARFR